MFLLSAGAIACGIALAARRVGATAFFSISLAGIPVAVAIIGASVLPGIGRTAGGIVAMVFVLAAAASLFVPPRPLNCPVEASGTPPHSIMKVRSIRCLKCRSHGIKPRPNWASASRPA
jgi:hypothetical protein